MKKLLIMVAAGTFLGFTAIAQQTTFGARAGMTGSNIKAKGNGVTMSFDTKLGFYAGVLAEIGVSENFAVEPQLNFSQMGAKINMSIAGETLSGTTELGYLSLPILAKYKNSGFSAFAGPQIGYLLYAKDKANGESEDSKDGYKSIDLSGVVGVGYTLTNGFGFDARYNLGLSNIAEDTEGDATVKNNGFALGVHYFFNR